MSFVKIGFENVTIEECDAATGYLVRRQRVPNSWLRSGRRQIRNLMGYPSMPGLSMPKDAWTPNYIALGSNGAATTDLMVGCQTEAFRKEITSRIPGESKITYYLFVASDECNGGGSQELREIALHCNSTDALAWARATFSLITKNAGLSLNLSWDMIFANA